MPPTSARECLHEPAPNSGLPPEVLIEVVLKPREGVPSCELECSSGDFFKDPDVAAGEFDQQFIRGSPVCPAPWATGLVVLLNSSVSDQPPLLRIDNKAIQAFLEFIRP
jgi:hypothetical protein